MKENVGFDGIWEFFLWVFGPCARYRLNRGEINQRDFDTMKTFLLNGKSALNTRNSKELKTLIRTCFARAFRDYIYFVTSTDGDGGRKYGGLWSLESVLEFFTNRHKHKDEHIGRITKDVWLLTIIRFDGENPIVSSGDRQFCVVNYYKLHLNVSDQVYTHKEVVVRVAKSIVPASVS